MKTYTKVTRINHHKTYKSIMSDNKNISLSNLTNTNFIQKTIFLFRCFRFSVVHFSRMHFFAFKTTLPTQAHFKLINLTTVFTRPFLRNFPLLFLPFNLGLPAAAYIFDCGVNFR